MSITDKVIPLWEAGLSYAEIGVKLNITSEAVRSRVRRWKVKNKKPHLAAHDEIDFSDVFKILQKSPKSLKELSEIFNRSESSILQIIQKMQDAGYSISEDSQLVTMPIVPYTETGVPSLFDSSDEFTFSFAYVSDTHAGSRYEQPTALRDFSHIAKEEYGCEVIIHTGDVVAGYRVYRGQEMDLYCLRGEEQAESAAQTLPEGFKIYLLGGNHDYSFYKSSGLDVRQELVRSRNDITLLSYDAHDLTLIEGIDARLWHPAGGPAYAISYKGQRYSEQLAASELFDITLGEKPKPTIRMVLIGHFHKMFSFPQGPIEIIGGGCFEGENSLFKRRGWIPEIGGTIIKVKVVDGFIHRIELVRIRYKETENDWRYWWYKRQPKVEEVVEKVFSIGS